MQKRLSVTLLVVTGRLVWSNTKQHCTMSWPVLMSWFQSQTIALQRGNGCAGWVEEQLGDLAWCTWCLACLGLHLDHPRPKRNKGSAKRAKRSQATRAQAKTVKRATWRRLCLFSGITWVVGYNVSSLNGQILMTWLWKLETFRFVDALLESEWIWSPNVTIEAIVDWRSCQAAAREELDEGIQARDVDRLRWKFCVNWYEANMKTWGMGLHTFNTPRVCVCVRLFVCKSVCV